MKRNVQPDSGNKKIMIIFLGGYAGPKKSLEYSFACERKCYQTLEIFSVKDKKKQMADFLPVIPQLISYFHVFPSGYVSFLLILPSSFLFSFIFSVTLHSPCLFSYFANCHLVSILLSISFSSLKIKFQLTFLWLSIHYKQLSQNYLKRYDLLILHTW